MPARLSQMACLRNQFTDGVPPKSIHGWARCVCGRHRAVFIRGEVSLTLASLLARLPWKVVRHHHPSLTRLNSLWSTLRRCWPLE